MSDSNGSEIKVPMTHASKVANDDVTFAQSHAGRRFSYGTRPVIRWIKGNGLDDEVTRAAIGQATRLFGNEVDYCLCTQGIDADRVRNILEWASQPVEWWPVSENDNPELARFLLDSGCSPENFGYWWKWFPERARPAAPEWILDGDMVLIEKPDWYYHWLTGKDKVRISQTDNESDEIYGRYAPMVDSEMMLYSGLVSLPPGCRYMPMIADVLTRYPLEKGHHGINDMDEQGVIAAAFEKLKPIPIPLFEFPFCRAFQDYIDYGQKGNIGRVWGYHFGWSFRLENEHFKQLTSDGTIFSKAQSSLVDQFVWLGNYGQWGIPGWSMTYQSTETILKHAATFAGKHVLELGTSRGRLTAMLATLGCNVTTLDYQDRGAGINLSGLNVTVLVEDGIHFMNRSESFFDLVICDMHGNSPHDWERYSAPLMKYLKKGSTLIINNYLLNKISEWHEETGVEWFIKQLPQGYKVVLYEDSIPGVAVVAHETIPIVAIDTDEFRSTFSKKSGLLVKSLSSVVDEKHRGLIHSVLRRMRIMKNSMIIRRSPYFCKSYYLENNPDVAQTKIDPATHYLLYGGFEGRNPSNKFNSAFYLMRYPDLRLTKMNPLLHYLRYGIKENREPVPKELKES
jgi:predicted O-methyltransferase YrrM